MESPSILKEVYKIDFIKERIDALRLCISSKNELPTLWIGAGLSAHFANFPTWRVFLQNFLAERYDSQHYDYEIIKNLIDAGKFDLAVELFTRSFEQEFYKKIETSFSKKDYSLPHFLRSWGLRDIITTNYDSLIEECFISHDVALPSSGIDALISARPKVVKIHGTADFPNSCVASISHYIRNYDNNLEWYLTDVFQTRSVIFIGSSMNPSEPFFKILNRLKRSDRLVSKHHCILPVSSREEAKKQGKRLGDLGINVIPYFPGKSHKFVDELLLSIDKFFNSKEEINGFLQMARGLVRAGKMGPAIVLIRYAFEKPGITEPLVLQLIDLIFEVNRRFKDESVAMGDPQKMILLSDIAEALLASSGCFVRNPRTLKSLHALTMGVERFANQMQGVRFNVQNKSVDLKQLKDRLSRMYNEKKQMWRLEKPTDHDDGLP